MTETVELATKLVQKAQKVITSASLTAMFEGITDDCLAIEVSYLDQLNGACQALRRHLETLEEMELST